MIHFEETGQACEWNNYPKYRLAERATDTEKPTPIRSTAFDEPM